MTDTPTRERTFPIFDAEKRYRDSGPPRTPRTAVPWSEAEAAYETYSTLYGTEQSLERLAERGGFSRMEFAVFRAGLDMQGRVVIDRPPASFLRPDDE